MADEIVSAQRLRELLHYCPETGVFTRLVRTSKRIKVGDVAGYKNPRGYIKICLLGRPHYAHRLAWLHTYGVWPAAKIDHRDGDRANNAIANLRDVSQSVNQQNQRRAHSRSSHGFLGASRSGKRWKSQIGVDGNLRHIGSFGTPEEAHAAYVEMKRKIHEGCTI